jgi:hypothetical protein
MHLSIAVLCGLLSASQLVLPVAAQSASANETLLDLSSQALEALNDADSSSTKRSSGCSLSQAYARKDW